MLQQLAGFDRCSPEKESIDADTLKVFNFLGRKLHAPNHHIQKNRLISEAVLYDTSKL